MKTFVADALDIGDVALKTEAAFSYSRKFSRPSAVLYKNIRRRFGHAATDRQIAYLTQEEIDEVADYNNLNRKSSVLLVLICFLSASICSFPCDRCRIGTRGHPVHRWKNGGAHAHD